ncbi:MAG: phosphohistidine phosphatase SixA [Deltaproteobacteria bacterium]|nr:phosphohistidine phosphatase SixA [Deltaproteobacteria bacterium]
MGNDDYDGPERRDYFRVVYPLAQRPRLRIRHYEFEVQDVSEKGIRFLIDTKITFAKWVQGVLVLHDDRTVEIDGKIVWRHGHEIGLQLISPIPYTHILKEQQYLISMRSRSVRDEAKQFPSENPASIRVYLARHGNAAAEHSQLKKPLSEKGADDVERTARFLKQIKPIIGVIQHSDEEKAIQTAEILHSQIAAARGTLQKSSLGPMDPIEPLLDEIQESREDMMIVGHLPFLNNVATNLLDGQKGKSLIAFKEGGVACLARNSEGKWRIEWILTPDLLP